MWVMKNSSTINATVNKHQRGFHMALANGYTVSIQFGSGNYCDVRDYAPNTDDTKLPPARCVEIGIFKRHPTWGMGWVKLSDHDDVAGWVPVDDIPAILVAAQSEQWDTIRHIIANPMQALKDRDFQESS